MAILDLYSKRQKRLRGEEPDILVYDEIPKPLRIQIIFIWEQAIGNWRMEYSQHDRVEELYRTIRDLLRAEYGVFKLSEADKHYPDFELRNYFLECSDTDKLLDQIEITFRLIESYVSTDEYQRHLKKRTDPKSCIEELNTRFREHGVGYQFESGEIIRVDSTLLHAEAVKPALLILGRPEYAGANEEFLKAHDHYRHGNYKETLNECLKALESVLKVICDKQKWPYKQTDTAKPLIDICFKHELVPKYLQSQYASLRSILESGVPTARNKASGHGQGSLPVSVPPHFAQYILHLTVSTILFLAKSEEQLNID